MAGTGSFDCQDMRRLQRELEKLRQNTDAFLDACAKELAARLLAKVVKRTPVGVYSKEIEVVAKRDSKNHIKGDKYTKRVNPSGKKGGTLRRGWVSESSRDAENGSGSPSEEEILGYVNGLQVSRSGGIYKIEIANPVEYAPYVEYGHRQKIGRYVPALGKKLKSGWVQGKLMLTISEREIKESAPRILEKKIRKFLGDAFDDK